MNPSSMGDVDFYLLGSGILGFLDMTVMTQHILGSKCKTLYYLHDLPSLDKYLKNLIPEATNLLPIYYKEGRDRDDIYWDVVRHVTETPPEKRPAGLLLHGHPLVCSTISQRLIGECEKKGFSLEILPAVSSLDRMFVDLKLDIFDHGIQIFTAVSVVEGKIPLNPRVGCFLFQVGSLNGRAERLSLARSQEIADLKNYLLNYYPPDHLVKIVESAVEVGFSSQITEVKVDALTDARLAFDYNASMYIPPLNLR